MIFTFLVWLLKSPIVNHETYCSLHSNDYIELRDIRTLNDIKINNHGCVQSDDLGPIMTLLTLFGWKTV